MTAYFFGGPMDGRRMEMQPGKSELEAAEMRVVDGVPMGRVAVYEKKAEKTAEGHDIFAVSRYRPLSTEPARSRREWEFETDERD